MKNSKLTTYILLALVIGIWGYVVYLIIENATESDVVPPNYRMVAASETDLNYYRWQNHLTYDSLELSPFDDLSNTRLDGDALSETERIFDEFENYDALIYAPAIDIQYLGFIENDKRKEKIAIVQINGHQQFMRVDQSINGFLLRKINHSEISVQIDQEIMTIPKQ